MPDFDNEQSRFDSKEYRLWDGIMSEYNNEQPDEQPKEYKSVGGWLLLLCISLTIVAPIHSLYDLITSHELNVQLIVLDPDIESLINISIVLYVVVTVLSVRAGIALWKIKPRAVKIAKNYLLILFVYSIISILLTLMTKQISEEKIDLIADVDKSQIRPLISFVIWYWYLSVSKRVKATYSNHTSPEGAQSTSSESENIESN